MPLTDIQIKSAKPRDKQYKIFDGDGLFLLITPKGGKYWRFKYRFAGKEKLLALGVYPDVPLKGCYLEANDKASWIDGARELRAKARKQLAAGIDPGEIKRLGKSLQYEHSENSFELVAREWHSKNKVTWTEGHANTILSRLDNDVFPWLGKRPINSIMPYDLLSVLRRVEARGVVETAHRIKTVCGQVFRYAVATGRAERDISADLKGALTPTKKKHLAAFTKPDDVAGLLRVIDTYEGSNIVRAALKLAPLVFVRPGELRQAEWSEIDFEKAEWNIPAEKMKTGKQHLVPLSRQALEILQDLHPLTGGGQYVFHSHRSFKRPMSNNAINAALRRMGYDNTEMTGHGFRAMARTMLEEVLQVSPDLVEHQLAHTVRGPLGRAYNRTTHLPERKKMMQTWANYLDRLKSGGNVVSIEVYRA